MSKNETEVVINSQVKDSGGKIIFGDNTLCSQFLRDYIPLPYLKDVRPEDIEDVSDRFVPLFAQERNADRVKKVNIRGASPFFLVSLIEHKTHVDYNVCMQIFRYMVYIWDAYEKEAEQKQEGISKRSGFKYPVILPIVYYEGVENWTVPADFKSRIQQGEAFAKYIPDFEYYLVPLKEYSNEELLEKSDEISLVMLINKLQTPEDVEKFRRIPPQKLEEILRETPQYLLDIIGDVFLAFLLKENLPVDEAEDLVGKVREKKMGMLFENMVKMDIQEERRKTEEQRRKTEAERKKTEEQRKKTEEQRKKTEEQRRKTEEQRCRAEEAIYKLESSMKLFIKDCKNNHMLQDETMEKVMDIYQIDKEEAREKVERYWGGNV